MVDELLEISRVDTGSAELSLDEVEVGELARQSAAAAGAAGVPVDVDPAISGVRVLVDKRRIERVVTNLVANAEQYAGGVTRVAVEPGADGVRLIVADRGPGVAPAERERIFERFYRGQAAGQRGATDGTGLGLSLVAEHVRLHGGRVWVERGPGDDDENRFVVELPVGTRDGSYVPGASPPAENLADLDLGAPSDRVVASPQPAPSTEREPSRQRAAPGAPVS
jgi:signal transduction histidine kinase